MSDLAVTLFIYVVTTAVTYLPPIAVGFQMSELGVSSSIYMRLTNIDLVTLPFNTLSNLLPLSGIKPGGYEDVEEIFLMLMVLFLLKRYLTALQCSSHLLDADLPATVAELQMSELEISPSIYRCGGGDSVLLLVVLLLVVLLLVVLLLVLLLLLLNFK